MRGAMDERREKNNVVKGKQDMEKVDAEYIGQVRAGQNYIHL